MAGNLGELPLEERCSAVSPTKGRCKNPHMIGLAVCRSHGGATELSKRKSAKAKLLNSMKSFTTPIPENDWEANPINAFMMDFRRTVAHIRFFDEQIEALQASDLGWGRTKKEDIQASEFEGVNETYEAKINIIYAMQFDERKHLLQLQRVWINAKLDIARLDIEREKVLLMDTMITNVLTRLNHDVTDPEVRNIVRQELLALPASTVQAERLDG